MTALRLVWRVVVRLWLGAWTTDEARQDRLCDAHRRGAGW